MLFGTMHCWDVHFLSHRACGRDLTRSHIQLMVHPVPRFWDRVSRSTGKTIEPPRAVSRLYTWCYFCKMIPGFSGVVVVVVVALVVGATVSKLSWQYQAFTFEPRGVVGSFEPILTRYFRLAEFTIGLASGSIVLLISSSVFRGNGGHLPWFFASPLIVLGACVLFAVGFMIWIKFWYEQFQYGVEYRRFAYCVTKTLGISSAFYFCIGYIWLVVAATQG